MKKLLIVLLMLVLVSCTENTPSRLSFAIGATYYVSPSGSDANSCSLAAPCKTFTKVVGLVVAGDTVYLRGGTYKERLLISKSGVANAYITFTAYPNEIPVIDGATFTASNSSGMVNVSNANYVKINGITVINAPQAAIYASSTTHLEITNNKTNMTKASSGIGVWYSDQVLVSHNVVANSHILSEPQGGHEESVSIAGTTNFEVSYNEIYMSGQTAYLGNEAIDCKDGTRFGSVHHNYIHDYYAEGGGIYIDAWTHLTGNIDIYDNYSSNNGNGITLGSEQGGTTENVRVYNNIIYNVGAVGIGIPTRSTAGIRRNIEIYNNTIYKARWNGGAGIYVTETKISNIVIRNNLVYFNNTNGEIAAGTSNVLPNVSADHNIVFGPKSCSLEYPNCVEISNNPGGYANIFGNTTSDPRFINLTTPDLHLQASSPAIDKGVPVGYVIDDYSGTSRPQGLAYDVGAYEYASGAVPTNTPTKTPTPTNTPTPTRTSTPTSTLAPGTPECVVVTFKDGTRITVCK